MVIKFSDRNGVKPDTIKEIICRTLDILDAIGVPFKGVTDRCKEQMALSCMALCSIKNNLDEPIASQPLTTKQIIAVWNAEYSDSTSTGSYDSVRDGALKWLLDYGVIMKESGVKNSSTAGYYVSQELIELIKSFEKEDWEQKLDTFKKSIVSILDNKIESYMDKMLTDMPLQQIFYGAPGTGKSRYVDDVCKKFIHYRITFHPDTDYAAFVGCYKPKSHKKNMLTGNNLNETQLLSCFFDSNDKNKYPNATKARYLYEALIHTKDIRDLGLDANSIAAKLVANGFIGCAYTTEANCMYNIYDWLQQDGFIVENKITYEFVPQTFLKAYIEAWKSQALGTPVYLVIEEINRGNCAQIFGDLFQLLDRDKDGFSQYEVDADTDMQEYISSKGLALSGIKDSDGNDISSDVASGRLLKLPDNLYIWATMNTSDQSLFPIDSAFKRRWEWKYIKITNGYKKKENGEYDTDADGKKIPLNWKIETNDQDWYEFVKQINKIISNMTSSADKQLGYFFCQANEEKKITTETFVSKVLFYLWNDVFKDYGFDDANLFKYKTEDGKEEDLTFPDFYDEDGNVVDDVVKQFIEHVMAWKGNDKIDNS